MFLNKNNFFHSTQNNFLDSLELTDDDVIKNAEPTLFLNENTEKEIVEKLYKIEEEIPDDSLVENGFKFFPNEQSRLDELDVKLNVSF